MGEARYIGTDAWVEDTHGRDLSQIAVDKPTKCVASAGNIGFRVRVDRRELRCSTCFGQQSRNPGVQMVYLIAKFACGTSWRRG
jgi:hypothetical protein